MTKTEDIEEMDTSLMEIKNLGFRYNKKIPLIENLNFSLERGEIVGISGENGTGKSTLLKLIVGLLPPKKGMINRIASISYSPQQILLFDNLTIKENFQVFGKGRNMPDDLINQDMEKIMHDLNFSQYRDELIKNLSGGTAQKVNFGIALLGNPDILVLDEPYQGLDYSSFLSFWDIQYALRQMGKSIIIVSHLIEDQSKFSRSLHLVNKKLQSCNRIDCPQCCGEDVDG